jgi:hypothetical protein
LFFSIKKKDIPNWKDDLHIRSTINVDNATKSEKIKKVQLRQTKRIGPNKKRKRCSFTRR